MAEKITTLSTLKWFRDKFAAWFVTSWLYLLLWLVVGIAFAVLLYIDGIFSRSLAPESIEPLSFQAMGWAYRIFADSFLIEEKPLRRGVLYFYLCFGYNGCGVQS